MGSHFKLINDQLRMNLVVPAKIHTFLTEDISAVQGGGGLKGRGGNFVNVRLAN